MKKINVPNDQCPMDVLASMKDIEKAWIFLSKSVVDKLKSTADSVTEYESLTLIKWEATAVYPAMEILLLTQTSEWKRVHTINAINIDFGIEYPDPEDVLFLQMAGEK